MKPGDVRTGCLGWDWGEEKLDCVRVRPTIRVLP